MAFKFTKGSEGVVVLDTRQMLVQGIEAPLWTDLRVGWFLSVTAADDEDLTSETGMAETIGTGTSPTLSFNERVRIGLTDLQRNQIFCGFTNRGPTVSSQGAESAGVSRLVPGDLGIGTTNTNYWRPANGLGPNFAAQIFDFSMRASSTDGVQQHFPRVVGSVPGYATLLMLRFQRPDAGDNARTITMTIPQMPSGHSADVLFTSDPSEDLLRENMVSFPETVQQFGPVNLSNPPDAFMVYWPFLNSRLRIHAMGFFKVR